MGCVLAEQEARLRLKSKQLVNQGKTPAQKSTIKRVIQERITGLSNARKLAKKGILDPRLILVASGTLGAGAVARGRAAARQAIRPIQKPKAKPVTKTKQRPVDKVVPKDVTIPKARVDNLPKLKQAAIISSILTLAIGTKFIRIGGRTFPLKTPVTKSNRARWRKRLLALLKRKRFVFVPDMFSLVFGIKAKPGQKIRLLRVGRVFTGAEARPIV